MTPDAVRAHSEHVPEITYSPAHEVWKWDCSCGERFGVSGAGVAPLADYFDAHIQTVAEEAGL